MRRKKGGKHNAKTEKELLRRARTLANDGNSEAAIETYCEILALNPGHIEAQMGLGQLLLQSEKLEEAERVFRAAVRTAPKKPATHSGLASTLTKMERLEEAEGCLAQAVTMCPDDVEILQQLACILAERKRIPKAIAAFEKVLQLNPDRPETLNDLGVLYERSMRYDDARACFEKSIELNPHYPPAINNLAKTAKGQGRIEEAIGWYRKAIEVQPDYALAHSNLLIALHYQEDLVPEQLFQEHKAWAAAHASGLSSPRSHANDVDENRPLRIGYLSPDLRTHSVSFFLESILDAHDRSQYPSFAYAEVARPDETTARLKPKFEAYRSTVGLSDEAVAEMIRLDGIDILIDLAGHSADNRLLTMARKPAPVQVTYLGYPDTTGLGAVDYRLTDALADPEGSDKYCTERLIRLPQSFLCFRPPDNAPPPSSHRSDRPVTFGSFNSFFKVNQRQINTWAELLKRVPEARLLLKAISFRDPQMRETCCRAFAECGVERDRLQCVSWEPDQQGHLKLYNEIDIALDTFPYHGTTTTCEALWMGVPVVTRQGAVHASRVGSSLLHQVGLDELVAHSEEEYIECAAGLARDPERLALLRAELRERMAASPLCDARTFTHHFEQALRYMWRRWCREHGEERKERAGQDEVPIFTSPPQAGKVAPDPVVPETNIAHATGVSRAVQAALMADTLNRYGQRSKALVYALEGWTDVKSGRFQKGAPSSLLQAWQSPTLNGVLLRQCLAFYAHSTCHDRDHAREWLMAWVREEPENPEPFLRLGLLMALDAALAERPVPKGVMDALEHAANVMQDERSASALALCSNAPAELSLPYDGGRIQVCPDIRSFATYVLLEQGDWFEEDLDLFRVLVKPGSKVLDLGAGIGVYSLSAAQRTGPGGRVVSVEMASEEFKLLSRTAEPYPNWSVCGDPSVALDSPGDAGDAFDLVRVDPKGFELEVLSGMLKKANGAVVFGALRTGTETGDDPVRYYSALGYQCYAYLPIQRALSPVDDMREVDGYVLNTIAVKPDQLHAILQQIGL